MMQDGDQMTKIFKLFDYENAPILCYFGFIVLGWVYDTKAFFPFAAASLLTFCATKAICKAIRERPNE